MRILIVDDARTVRHYHRKLLTEAGWGTEIASNGIEALELVLAQSEDRPFDLFIVDINMPQMDGYAFVRELRRLGPPGQGPVLMVSTESQAHDSRLAFEAGADDFMIKPARQDALLDTVARLVRERARALVTGMVAA